MSGLPSDLPIWFLVLFLAIFGAIWGSFVAALCVRWPLGKSVMSGRSTCDSCGVRIAAYDLVPIFSYLILRGACRSCHQKIGWSSLAIEVTTVMIGAISALVAPGLWAVAIAVFGWILLPLVVLDLRHLWLPNRLVILLAIAGVPVGAVAFPQIELLDRAVGAILGFLSLEIIRSAYRIFRKQDGMGRGDPKLFAALGIWVGWQHLPLILVGATVLGLIAILFGRLISGNNGRTAFPLGAYLGISALLTAWFIAGT